MNQKDHMEFPELQDLIYFIKNYYIETPGVIARIFYLIMLITLAFLFDSIR